MAYKVGTYLVKELVTFLCEGENCVFIPSHTLVVSKTCLVSHSLTWGSDEVGLAMASQVVGVSVLVLRYPGYLVREYLEIEVNNCKNQRKTEGVVCQCVCVAFSRCIGLQFSGANEKKRAGCAIWIQAARGQSGRDSAKGREES